MSLPFTKFMDRADLQHPDLQEALSWVDRTPDVLVGQHVSRRWEYAMALYALQAFRQRESTLRILDAGGAGSQFYRCLFALTPVVVGVVDPQLQWLHRDHPEGTALGYPQALTDLAAETLPEAFDAITCLSVIEHLDQPKELLKAAASLLRPGGFFFLTLDAWGSEGPDTAHFRWMRKRIYNAASLIDLTNDARGFGFKSYAKADWRYHGPHVYDYSAASLALVKKR